MTGGASPPPGTAEKSGKTESRPHNQNADLRVPDLDLCLLPLRLLGDQEGPGHTAWQG